MKYLRRILLLFPIITLSLSAGSPTTLNLGWISPKPEVLTYRSHGDHGEGLYQVCLFRSDSLLELSISIISPGFSKIVATSMKDDLSPVFSRATIVVNDQVAMATSCEYGRNSATISTRMFPYNRTLANTLNSPDPLLDYAESPLLVRAIPLDSGSIATFPTISPRTNTLASMTLSVIGDGAIGTVQCVRVEVADFEGKSIYWIEKGDRRRVMRIEQPETHTVSELIQ